MLTTVLLTLLLASLVALALMFVKRGHTGPEGPVGAGIVFVPSLSLALLFFVAAGVSGEFAWLSPSPLAWMATAVGMLACLGVASFSLLDRGPIRWLAMGTIVLVGVACFLAVNPPDVVDARRDRRILALALILPPSLAGIAMLVRALVDRALSGRRQRAREEQEYEAARHQRNAQDAADFDAVPVDAPFLAVSAFLWSPNASVQARARARLAERSDLEAQMIEGLGVDGADVAVASYIAYVDERASPRLAPAFARSLDRRLVAWTRDHEPGSDPVQAAHGLSTWFDAAARIQAAGGDLRPSLDAWCQALQRVDGMDALVRRIREAG